MHLGESRALERISRKSRRVNLFQEHSSVEHVPPRLISQGWEVGTGETLYSKRGRVPTRAPRPSTAPSRRGRRPNILLSPNKWKDNALPNLGFGSWPTKLSIMGVSWHSTTA